MIGPFAVINEDFQRYLINFHIAREAFRREELPPEEVMDVLFEGKSANLPESAYKEEKEHSKVNLEGLIKLAVSSFARKRVPKNILTSDGYVPGYSYEDDKESDILYVLGRVKELSTFWLKSVGTIAAQKETGFFDQKGMRIIVENQQARHYRTHRRSENLSSGEKRKFKELFHGKKEPELSHTEKEKFYRAFSVEYKDLTSTEKREYVKLLEESDIKHGRRRNTCTNLAEKIAKLNTVDKIPINPLYMLLGSLELRVQRQVIVDYKGNKILEFEYLFGRDPSQSDGLLRKVLDSSGFEGDLNRAGKIAEYDGYVEGKSYLVNLGNLLVNFHSYGNSSIDIGQLTGKIEERYREALARFSDNSQDEKDSKKVGEVKKVKRESDIMEYIKLGMGNIPLGLLIYSETIIEDLTNKYAEMEFDSSKFFETFVKDRTGPNATDDGFQDAKLLLCFNPQLKQISGECQIRNPVMDYEAEHGKTRKGDRLEYERRKASRSVRECAKITDKDMELGRALFDNDESSNNSFSRIFADFYSRSILRIADEIARIEGIPKEFERFGGLLSRIELLYTSAKERVKPQDLESAVSAVNSVFTNYAMSKGIGILSYFDNLWEISKGLKRASETLNVKLEYFDSPKELGEFLHRKHIGMLWDIFVKLAQSRDIAHVASSLAVGRLIRQYNGRYGRDSLPAGMQKEYREKVDKFYEDMGWEPYKVGGSVVGCIPPKFLHGTMMRVSMQDGALDTSKNSPLGSADIGTIQKIMGAYSSIINMWPKYKAGSGRHK